MTLSLINYTYCYNYVIIILTHVAFLYNNPVNPYRYNEPAKENQMIPFSGDEGASLCRTLPPPLSYIAKDTLYLHD